MTKFRVNIILNYDYELELNQDTWDDLIFDDYTRMELINKDTGSIITAGDTTHDNIYYRIKVFLEGVNYGSEEGILVEYGFKIYNKEEIIKVEYMKPFEIK